MASGAFSSENNLKAQSLAEIYNDSAALYHKTFPEKLANLFITRGAEHIFLAPEVADFLTDNIAGVKEMVAYKAKTMRDQGWSAMATEFTGVEDGVETRINHLLLPEGAAAGFVSNTHPAEMNQVGIFDHEMGHFIVKGGTGDDINRAECAADAYAALRHIQRFGGGTDMLDHAASHRANNIVLYAVKTHYTSAAFQKIKALQEEGAVDIPSLSLPQTATLAAKIASACALGGATLERIHDAYADLRAALAEDPPDPEKGIKAAAAAVVKNKNDADICRAGKLFLDSLRIKSFIAAAGLEDDPTILQSRAVKITAAATDKKRAPPSGVLAS